MIKRYWLLQSKFLRPFISLAMASMFMTSVYAQAVPVMVNRVMDGDTVTVNGRPGSVRLSNIDAPERSHGYSKPGQPFSVVSAEFLEAQVLGQRGITMKCVEIDRYGRDVCELFRDGRSVNSQMVAAGLAWANTSAGGRYLRDKTLIGLQEQARSSKKGLWAKDSPSSPASPPWEWRDACWRQGVCLVPQQ